MQRAATLTFATLCWVFCSLVLAGATLAQERYDCASFGSQQSAQAELDRDPSDPSRLDADDDGKACETYPYDGGGEGPVGPTPEGTTPEGTTPEGTTPENGTPAQ